MLSGTASIDLVHPLRGDRIDHTIKWRGILSRKWSCDRSPRCAFVLRWIFSLVALAADHLESTQDDSTASLPGMWISNPERFGGSSQLFDSLRCSATTFAAASGCVKASGGAQADIHFAEMDTCMPCRSVHCSAEDGSGPPIAAADVLSRVASRVLGQRRVFRRGSDPLTRASAIPSERGPFRRGLRQACVASGCIGGWFPKRSEAKRTERLPPPGLRTDALSDFGGA